MTSTDTETTRVTTCAMCGGSFEQTRFFLFGQERFSNAPCLCSPCTLAYEQRLAAEKAQREWETMVARRLPDDYHRATVPNVPPCYARALTWSDIHARGGIGLIGASGSGKSCAMACVVMLRRQAFLWWSGTEARDAAIDAQTAERAERAECRARWEHAMRVPLLVLDDISQGKMTEGWSASLFDLLETRLSRSRPVLWTSQIGLAQLRAKIARQNGGDDAQADAITRRLSQHSLVLTG